MADLDFLNLDPYGQSKMKPAQPPMGSAMTAEPFQPVAAMQPPQAPTPPPPQQLNPYQQAAFQQAQMVGSSAGAMPMAAETQVQQKVIDPKAALAQTAADFNMGKALKAQGEAQAAEAEARAVGYDKLSREMEARQNEFNSLMNEFKSAKVVDPRNEWGTAGKIGAAISMALGAFAATYSGGRNYAADIIDGAIKRDIDLQESKIRKLGLDAQGAQGALATAYRKLGDMQQARNAVEVAAIAGVSDEIKAKAVKSDKDTIKANADVALAALEQKKAAAMSARNEMIIATTGKPLTHSAEMAALVTPYGTAPSKDAANTARQQAQEIQEARAGLADFKDVIKKYGSWNLVPGKEKGEYQGALLPVVNAYRVALNMGVLNPSEREKIESELKNKLSSKEANAFIDRMGVMIDNREKALQKAYIVGGGRNKMSDADLAKQGVGFSK